MLSAQIRQPILCQLTWSLLHSSSHTKPGFRREGTLKQGLGQTGTDRVREMGGIEVLHALVWKPKVIKLKSRLLFNRFWKSATRVSPDSDMFTV